MVPGLALLLAGLALMEPNLALGEVANTANFDSHKYYSYWTAYLNVSYLDKDKGVSISWFLGPQFRYMHSNKP